MNAAFVEALKVKDSFHCFVFHDVDLVPEDDRNMYSCPQQPRHMSVAIDEMGYKSVMCHVLLSYISSLFICLFVYFIPVF